MFHCIVFREKAKFNCIVVITFQFSANRLGIPEAKVIGITVIGNHLYLLQDEVQADGNLTTDKSRKRQIIVVYETTSSRLQEDQKVLQIPGLSYSIDNGLTSCATENNLYVSDTCNNIVHVIRLANDNTETKPWAVGVQPRGLSVIAGCNLLVSCYGDKKLEEYSPDGSLKGRIDLDFSPRHAIQLDNDLFAVCGRSTRVRNLICQVKTSKEIGSDTAKGVMNKTIEQPVESTDCTRQLALIENKKFIIVPWYHTSRITILDFSGNDPQELPASVPSNTLNEPSCLHLDISNTGIVRLYVGDKIGVCVLTWFSH
jgi:hypothetical protein